MLQTQSIHAERNSHARELLARMRNEELSLSEREAARNELFDQFKDLSLSFALQMMVGRYQGRMDDLKSESALALLHAIEYWQPEKGDLSTALFYYVRVRIRQFFKSEELISRSYNALLKASKLQKQGLDAGQYSAVHCDQLQFVALEDEMYRDVPDPNAEFEESLTLNIAVNQVVDSLPQHERKIVVLAFGLRGHRQHTLREAAEILGCSHEKVRLTLRHAKQTLHQSLSGYA